jgi:hypothetical protein
LTIIKGGEEIFQTLVSYQFSSQMTPNPRWHILGKNEEGIASISKLAIILPMPIYDIFDVVSQYTYDWVRIPEHFRIRWRDMNLGFLEE